MPVYSRVREHYIVRILYKTAQERKKKAQREARCFFIYKRSFVRSLQVQDKL